MNKWTPAKPSDFAHDVAVRSLRARFYALRRYLRLAATERGNSEDVHQLRVWSRRSEAAFSVFAGLLPRRQSKWLRKRIRRIRQAAGRVRDFDVLSKVFLKKDGTWPASLKKKRARAADKLVGLRTRLGRKLKRRMKKLLDHLSANSHEHDQLFDDYARTALRPIVAAFFDGSHREESDETALHRFRIASKELRYAMELLAGAFSSAFRDQLYPMLAIVQDKLGEINDLAALRTKLQDRLERSDDPAELSDLRRRLAAGGEDLEHTRADFAYTWSDDTRRDLHARFGELLGDSRAT
jgi:CHAD domain-containing protein